MRCGVEESHMSVQMFELALSMSASTISDLFKWLSSHVDHEFAVGLLGRWGLLGSGKTEHGDRRWDVKRLVWSSGNREGFQRNKFYASHRTSGGRRTFWHMDFWTLESQDVFLEGEIGSPICSDIEEAPPGSLSPSFSLVFSKEKRLGYMLWLDNFCRENPDEFVCLGGPGMRNVSTAAIQYRMSGVPVFCHSKSGECVRASIANALHAAGHDDSAEAVLLRGKIAVRSLGEAQKWLERNLGRFRLCKVQHSMLKSTEKWLEESGEGVFLVRLKGSDSEGAGVDNVVAVDANRSIVLDCVEKLVLRLQPGVLAACVGDGKHLDEVAEVRRLEVQKSGKGKNNRRKSRPKRREEKKKEVGHVVRKAVCRRKKRAIECEDEE